MVAGTTSSLAVGVVPDKPGLCGAGTGGSVSTITLSGSSGITNIRVLASPAVAPRVP